MKARESGMPDDAMWRTFFDPDAILTALRLTPEVRDAVPRGPSMAIRPRPADCRRWIEEAGFAMEGGIVALPPYHYGLSGRKRANA